jgi:hypothetical protein
MLETIRQFADEKRRELGEGVATHQKHDSGPGDGG